ncbi:MAG: hypothetical protein KJP04_02010 [Arenicella sp.]|nr:hypothetical protein [Arenicella sp.]
MLGIFNQLGRKQLEQTCEDLRLLAEKQKAEITQKENHITVLTQNARKWAKKFREPTYSVPERVIREMEEEAEQYRERTKAELTRIRAQKAELVQRLVAMQIAASDKFGSKEGDADVTYDLVDNHDESQVSEEDKQVVEMELADAVKARLAEREKAEKS